jgi:apolipoprotein N-acyltransferase
MAAGASLIWLGVGGVLFGLVARLAIAPAAWVGLICFLHAVRSMSPIAGFLSAWIAIYAGLCVGLFGIVPASGSAYFAIIGFYSTTFAFPFTVDRLVATSLGGIAGTLVFPSALAAVEFLRARFAPSATWGSLAYSQYGIQPVMQVAAFAGIWGITFVVGWAASTAQWASSQRFDWEIVRTPVVACTAVVSLVMLAGTVRILRAPTDRPTLRMTTLNRPTDLFVPGEMTRITEGSIREEERQRLGEKLVRLREWFLEGTRREARAGARLVAWPEQNLLIFAEDEPAFLERAKRVAAEEHVYLAIGMGTIHLGDARPFENKLIVIDADGTIVASYLKTHPVAGWEAGIMRPGDGQLPIVSTAHGRLSGAICFDADFPELIRQAGQGSADLLIVPANDWRSVKELHAQMAAFRAIENGVSLIRPAASGISTAFDPWGRQLGAADFFAPGDRTLTVQVPVAGIWTLYARTGDLFAWLCVLGMVASLGFATFGRGLVAADAAGRISAGFSHRPKMTRAGGARADPAGPR